MHTVFTLIQRKNSGLFRVVVDAFDSLPIENIEPGEVSFANLHWKFSKHDEMVVTIDGLAVQLPPPLKYASFESIEMFDVVADTRYALGNYRYKRAKAIVTQQWQGHGLYGLVITGDPLSDMNELYRRLTSGELQPNQN